MGEHPRVIREGKEHRHEGSFEESKVDSDPWRLILPASDRDLASSGQRLGEPSGFHGRG